MLRSPLPPSEQNLKNGIIAAVGDDGLRLVREQCGTHFSLTDLRRAIASMEDGPERETLRSVVRIIEDSHDDLLHIEGE